MEHDKEPIEVPDHDRPTQVLNVPAYCVYREDWSGSIFGFFHIEEFFPLASTFPAFQLATSCRLPSWSKQRACCCRRQSP